MAMSHTGSLTGRAWVYEQAFKQAGILRADEVDELVDRVQFLEQIPKERWTPINGLFVLTATGGWSQPWRRIWPKKKASTFPTTNELAEWVGTILPGTTVANPLTRLASPCHVTMSFDCCSRPTQKVPSLTPTSFQPSCGVEYATGHLSEMSPSTRKIGAPGGYLFRSLVLERGGSMRLA